MARMARVVVPDIPHHVTQRGNRRQTVFFTEQDYETYLQLISTCCRQQHVHIWGYCLMPNHVHLILVPRDEAGLAKAVGETHRRYTRAINFRKKWKGFLWQGRFSSFPMDDRHLYQAVRYVELNPVNAGLVKNPEDWKWSSAGAHLRGEDDAMVVVAPMLHRVGDWSGYLSRPTSERDKALLQLHERTGRPLGSDAFIDRLERRCGRTLRPLKPGPKSSG